MYGSVKLRSRNANNNNSSYVTRPRSWGEFQSKLSTFQRISAPGTNANVDVRSTDAKTPQEVSQAVHHTPSDEHNAASTNIKGRPASESSVQTPFFKPFRPFGQRTSSSDLDVSVFTPNLPPPPASSALLPTEKVDDAPSLAFEEALGVKPAEREAEGITVTAVADRLADSASPRDLVFVDPSRNAKPPPEGTLQATASRLSDSAYECASEASGEGLSLSSDIGLPEDLGKAASEGASSDVSSIVDTGFYSVEEKEALQGSPDRLDFHFTEGVDMEDNKAPAAAPRKSRSTGIPKSLRSCYNHNYVLDGGDVSSKSSLDFTDEEILSERSRDSKYRPHQQASKQQGSGLPVPTRRMSSEQPKNRVSTSSESSFKSESDASSQPSVRKGILRKPKSDQHGQPANGEIAKVAVKELGWKDDQIVDIGYYPNKTIGDKNNGVSAHGTWPRRQQKSRKKQGQEEAEELLRRFRETSDSYRHKFRDVFAETRRKMEEAVFGLRVTMAKNGYSARCYQPKFTTTNLPRDAKA